METHKHTPLAPRFSSNNSGSSSDAAGAGGLSDEESGWAFLMQRWVGAGTAAAVSVVAFLSPIAMLMLPQMGIWNFREAQLRCDVSLRNCVDGDLNDSRVSRMFHELV